MKLKIIFGIVILLLTSGCSNSFDTCMDNCMEYDDEIRDELDCELISEGTIECLNKYNNAKKHCYEVCSGK